MRLDRPPASEFLVYALLDPETFDVRYIGKSSSGFRRPQERHSAHCRNWVESLKRRGLSPVVRVVSYEIDNESANEAEIYWIKKFRAMKADLTNILDGGQGIPKGYKFPRSVVEKRAATQRGQKRPWAGPAISAARQRKKDSK